MMSTAKQINIGTRCVLVLAAVATTALVAGRAQASLIVAGSPGFDSTTSTGLRDGSLPVVPGSCVNNIGVAVAYSDKYVSGSWVRTRAVRWDASGTAATELGNLDTIREGAKAFAVNDAGTAVGFSEKYVSIGTVDERAVRWDASGTAATELGHLGTDNGGSTVARASAVNNAGTAVGYSRKHISGNSVGRRAVRWDASVTAATELGHLGTDSSGDTVAQAYAINDAGTTVGYSYKYVSGSFVGSHAVRWDASGTAATELGHLGINSRGSSHAQAYAVNDAGTAVGSSNKFVSGSDVGLRAVRWDASGTVATELGHLGTNSSGSSYAQALAVNDAGTAVGYSYKYVSGGDVGWRAVRWDASGTAATELGNLGTDSSGFTRAQAFAVNDAGTAVGFAYNYDSGSSVSIRAVIWGLDAVAIDLNDLGAVANPAGGTWTLTSAAALSEDGWVAGTGTFDPYGYATAYNRHWVGQVGLGGDWLNTTGTGNTWGKGRNWSTGTPAIQLDAIFNSSATYTVAFDDDERARSVTISNGDVTFALAGRTLKAGQINVGGASNTGNVLRLANSTGVAVVTGSLNIATSSTLALNDSAMVIDYVSATPQAAMVEMILDQRINATNVVGMSEASELGVTSFRGTSVDSTALLILNTLAGDTNLDRVVNFTDLLSLAQHYGTTVNATWSRGDFDYNDRVDFADLLKLAQGYGQSLSMDGSIQTDPVGASAFAADWARAISLIPEPTTLTALAGVGLLAPRRRR